MRPFAGDSWPPIFRGRTYESAEIREAFLRFFEEKGHTRVASSSLIPANDPTLLFTNAGMNQFRTASSAWKSAPTPVRPPARNACAPAQAQRPGKRRLHRAAPHFFEMLGNFSFGDYFKRDAIHYAWEFLTGEKWLNLPKEKLWVTVYATDDEAYDIWTRKSACPPSVWCGSATTRARPMRPTTSGRWAIPDPAVPAPRSSSTMGRRSGAARPVRRKRTATATSRSGTTCSCSSTAPRTASCTAAGAERGHRHGPGARQRGTPARALEL